MANLKKNLYLLFLISTTGIVDLPRHNTARLLINNEIVGSFGSRLLFDDSLFIRIKNHLLKIILKKPQFFFNFILIFNLLMFNQSILINELGYLCYGFGWMYVNYRVPTTQCIFTNCADAFLGSYL